MVLAKKIKSRLFTFGLLRERFHNLYDVVGETFSLVNADVLVFQNGWKKITIPPRLSESFRYEIPSAEKHKESNGAGRKKPRWTETVWNKNNTHIYIV